MMPTMEQAFLPENPKSEYPQHGLYYSYARQHPYLIIGMWVRMATCYCKIDGKWMVTHEHQSVPFDAESGKALLDLKP
jgi:hypothetical protein